MKNLKAFTLGLSLLALSAVGLPGCGGGAGAGEPQNTSYLGTQAPGDVWNWSFDGNTFTGANETLDHSYSGTWIDLPSGFRKLTVSGTNDGDVQVGDTAYAIEMPGVALLVKPAGGDMVKPIIATSVGADPTTDSMMVNYIVVPHNGWDMTQEEAFGTAHFFRNDAQWIGDIVHYQLDGTVDPEHGVGVFGCIDGHLVVDNGAAQGTLTPAGLAMIDNGPGMGGMVGVPVPSQNISWSDFASKQFRGLMLNGGRTECIWMQPNGDGDLLGGAFDGDSGIETNTHNDGPGVTISFVAQPSPGILRVNATSPDGTDTVALMVGKVNGKYIAFGLGGNPQQGAFNLLLVEK